MRVADYVVKTLADHGLRHVFLVTGGGAMHLNDAFTRNNRLKPICFHHEQACAMAADGYARLSGMPAIINVTTGPGAINALNGVFGAFTDSIPMVVIGGQVKTETIKGLHNPALRQLGDQEVDIISMVKPITKFSECVYDKADIRYILEKALYLVNSGRPGPVWVDIPGDIQGAQVEPESLRSFDPNEITVNPQSVFHDNERDCLRGSSLNEKIQELRAELERAKRPVILVGTGVRISGKAQRFREEILRLGVPVATAFNAHDIIPFDHPLFAGKAGTVGDRAGNFAVQNADLVIVLGCRLNIRQISYNWASFARHAYKVMVDVDRSELEKPTLDIDLPIHADLRDFFVSMDEVFAGYQPQASHTDYVEWCVERREKYPVTLPEYFQKESPVNPYVFGEKLFEKLFDGDVVVTANATACVCMFQSAKIHEGVRLFSNSGSASMGFDLPAAIGAELAKPRSDERIVCIAGDGSIMMNLQELQTIKEYKLPTKIFLLCNDGYHSIYQTQKNFFSDNVIGCGPGNGLSFPDFIKISVAFDIPAREVSNHSDLDHAIKSTLEAEGAQLCIVHLDKAQPFAPKLSSRRLPDGRMVTSPLEDMAPFLDRDELKSNLLIPAAEE
jgi:acetolactate synthase-1/2/3 large subunit